MPDQLLTHGFVGIMFSEPLFDALKRVGPNLSKDALLRELTYEEF